MYVMSFAVCLRLKRISSEYHVQLLRVHSYPLHRIYTGFDYFKLESELSLIELQSFSISLFHWHRKKNYFWIIS